MPVNASLAPRTRAWYAAHWAEGTTCAVMASLIGISPLKVGSDISNLRRMHPEEFPKRAPGRRSIMPIRAMLRNLEEVNAEHPDVRLELVIENLKVLHGRRKIINNERNST